MQASNSLLFSFLFLFKKISLRKKRLFCKEKSLFFG